MLISEIIRRKRDGETLTPEEIRAFVAALADGTATEGQVAAFAMAVYFRGLDDREAAELTLAMRDSGDVFHWDLPGPVIDKHSTGGVGDNVSLMLAPIVAACGAFVPMISGRGLGHTGGTLDKMSAIPGYNVTPDNETFARVVRETGCAIIGQTARLAPADKRFYAIRDVTATVESIPLITASILSKKLAAGLDALVMDVKFGNGAFMDSQQKARDLAQSLTRVAREAGLACHALLTDMNQPLASAAGNAVEVMNALDFLAGRARDPRLEEVVLALAGEMLAMTGLAEDREAGRARARAALDDGRATERFAAMVHALGGPADLTQRPEAYLPRAPVTLPVPAPRAGWLAQIATREVGLIVVELGGGRRRADDEIDLSVGLTGLLPLGTRLEAGAPLATVHAATEADATRAAQRLQEVCVIADEPPEPAPVIGEIIA